MVGTPAWVRKLKANYELKRSVGEAFKDYAQLEVSKARSLKLARESDEQFDTTALLQPHKVHTLRVIGDVEQWNGAHLLESLRFFAEESRSHNLQWAAFNGPLLGGLFTLIVTVVVLALA